MTTALRRRLGLIPAEQPTAPAVEAEPVPDYTSDRAAQFHTYGITR